MYPCYVCNIGNVAFQYWGDIAFVVWPCNYFPDEALFIMVWVKQKQLWNIKLYSHVYLYDGVVGWVQISKPADHN